MRAPLHREFISRDSRICSFPPRWENIPAMVRLLSHHGGKLPFLLSVGKETQFCGCHISRLMTPVMLIGKRLSFNDEPMSIPFAVASYMQ